MNFKMKFYINCFNNCECNVNAKLLVMFVSFITRLVLHFPRNVHLLHHHHSNYMLIQNVENVI